MGPPKRHGQSPSIGVAPQERALLPLDVRICVADLFARRIVCLGETFRTKREF
jgi:hypothetical protein